jgi:hypothetical protein
VKVSVVTAQIVKDRIMEAAHATRGIPDTSLVFLLVFTGATCSRKAHKDLE